MHRAPATSFPVARSRWHLRVILLLWSMGALASVALLWDQTAPEVHVGVLACLLLIGAVSLWGWKHAPSGRLQWDGQHWQWSGLDDAHGCHLDLLLDFQVMMLVCLRDGTQRRVWLWLDGVPGDPKWIALRRAVVSDLRGSRTRSAPETPQQPDEGMV